MITSTAVSNNSGLFVPVWFSDGDVYTFSDQHGHPILYTEMEARQQPSISGILRTESDVENADDDIRYAIDATLLEELFGYDINQ